MSVTEHLMRPGSGSLRFTSGVPAAKVEAIRKLVDENNGSGAIGASVVITPTRMDVASLTDANILAGATYHGPITARPSRTSLEFGGLGLWLDTYVDANITRSSGTPSQWIGDLVTNDLSSGTITATGLSNVSRTFTAYAQTHRQALDAWAGLAGAEYRIMPDLTIDAATAANLFVQAGDAGTVIVTRKAEGPDGSFRGVDGSLLDQALTQLGPNLATKAIALAEGDGLSIATGSDTQSLNLKAPSGSAPDLCVVFSAPSEESANANTAAANFLNLQGMRRAVNVSSSTHHLPRFVVPGDEVYVYDPPAGLYDTSNQIQFRGETISPIVVRLLSYTWPIEEGMGVYVRSNAATPTYIDVTDWVEWEDGDTWWTVGDWSPPSYGPVNRTNPEIEERVSDPGAITWSPTITQSSAVSGTVNRGWYVKRPDGTFAAFLTWTASGSGTASNIISISLPFTLPNIYDCQGTFRYNDAGTIYTGTVVSASTTTVTMWRDGATSGLGQSSPTIASSDTIRMEIHGRYV